MTAVGPLLTLEAPVPRVSVGPAIMSHALSLMVMIIGDRDHPITITPDGTTRSVPATMAIS